MLNPSESNDANPLTAVFELIQKRLPADVAALAEAFTQRDYAQVASEDQAEGQVLDL